MTKNSFLLRTAGNSPFASSPSFGLLREFPDIVRSGFTLALLEIVEKKSFAVCTEKLYPHIIVMKATENSL
jgi:hypothetical protein